MSPEEIRQYLKSNRLLILVSNGPGGFPHPMPMNYFVDDEDRILVTSFAKSQKVLNLRRDPRASLLVETGGSYTEYKSVIAYANAEIIDEPTKTAELFQMVARQMQQNVPAAPEVRAQAAASLSKRVMLRFHPTRYVSWDHSKLQGRY